MRDKDKTIGNLIDKASYSQLCYIDDEGFPQTRAMLKPREREGIKEFYFTTNTSSNKVKCLRENTKASIYFIDRRFFRGVSLKGFAQVLTDEKSKKRIFREGDEIYYPLGVDDPDYCVIKFTAISGRYYSNYKSEDFTV